MDSKVDILEDTAEEGLKAPAKQVEECSASIQNGDDIPLEESLKVAHEAIDFLLNNQFDEACDMVKPLADRSIYHAMIYGLVRFFEAMMSFEQDDIAEALDVLSQCCDTINRFRKKTTFTEKLGRMMMTPNYNDYTDMEVHAEFVFAAVLNLKASLTIYEDHSLTSLIKAGLDMKAVYN